MSTTRAPSPSSISLPEVAVGRTSDEGAEMDVWDTSMQGGLTEPELFSAVPKPSGIGFPVAVEVLASVFASQEHL